MLINSYESAVWPAPLKLYIPRICFHFLHCIRLTIHGEGEFLSIDYSLNLFVVEWVFHFIIVNFVQAALNARALFDLQIITFDCPTSFYVVSNSATVLIKVNAHDDSLLFELSFLIIKFSITREFD
ncbi:hypothetical protein KOSB73_220073 [Klebsiella grimontii]|uniref:Uncharacterized protein n=1 Tax=Klebsiella grimontii TaxID=2058152 RepID=A0A285AZ39_9ENTR|nr:hypothetical protein KOSB73_220073 [Klebsiella grimontii]